jgi:hypothetical protein
MPIPVTWTPLAPSIAAVAARQYLGRRLLLQAVRRGSAAGHGQRYENASGRQADGVLPDGVAGLLDQLV